MVKKVFTRARLCIYIGLTVVFFYACSGNEKTQSQKTENFEFIVPDSIPEYALVVLGTVQDGGSPHIQCKKPCCKDLFNNKHPSDRKVVSLGIIDKKSGKSYLIEATPDITEQIKLLYNYSKNKHNEIPSGIFLTHAHIGHYSGLMYLGKEAAGCSLVPVFAMPRMKSYLEKNGPWSQLVSDKNIELHELKDSAHVQISDALRITPITVPHRDEYSETVGYLIQGPNKKVLFIPDIDKWEKWRSDIIDMVKSVDYAFIDATFYSGDELKQRDISKIPHPFVIETMKTFKEQSDSTKKKIHFIHFNHTNPLLQSNRDALKTVLKNGFNIAKFGQCIAL